MATDERDPTDPDTGALAVAEGGEGKPEKLPQVVEVRDAGPCKKHVKVTVDRRAIDSQFDAKYTELVFSETPIVNGFRPGKVPRKMIEQRYYKSVAAEVKTAVLMASLEQLAEEQSISPLSPPELNPDKIEIPKEGPFVYEFEIEVRPEFDLPDYKGLTLRRPVHDFTGAEVEAEERRMLERYGQVVPKEGDAPTVSLNDTITADVAVKLGDRELNALKEIRVKVDRQLAMADGVAEDFGKVMAGAKVGDTRTVDIVLSQDPSLGNLRGTAVQAAFTVKDIKTLRLPELTPELLAKFGVNGTEQFSELAKATLEQGLVFTQRQVARKEVLEKLAKAANWDLPQDMLRRQARKMISRKVMEMQSSGMSEDQIRGRQRLLEQDALRSTAAALKEHFVLQKVAEVEKIEIEDDDIEAEIDRIADQSGESARKVRARYEKEELTEALATDLLERKALDLILSTASYEDYELTPSEQSGPEVSTSSAQMVPAGSQEPAPADAPPAGGS